MPQSTSTGTPRIGPRYTCSREDSARALRFLSLASCRHEGGVFVAGGRFRGELPSVGSEQRTISVPENALAVVFALLEHQPRSDLHPTIPRSHNHFCDDFYYKKEKQKNKAYRNTRRHYCNNNRFWCVGRDDVWYVWFIVMRVIELLLVKRKRKCEEQHDENPSSPVKKAETKRLLCL